MTRQVDTLACHRHRGIGAGVDRRVTGMKIVRECFKDFPLSVFCVRFGPEHLVAMDSEQSPFFRKMEGKIIIRLDPTCGIELLKANREGRR